MRMVKAAWPCPVLISAPKKGAGDMGQTMMTPYRTRSPSFRARFRRGASETPAPAAPVTGTRSLEADIRRQADRARTEGRKGRRREQCLTVFRQFRMTVEHIVHEQPHIQLVSGEPHPGIDELRRRIHPLLRGIARRVDNVVGKRPRIAAVILIFNPKMDVFVIA